MRGLKAGVPVVIFALFIWLGTVTVAAAWTQVTPHGKMPAATANGWDPEVSHPWVVWKDYTQTGTVIRWFNFETSATGDIVCSLPFYPKIDGSSVAFFDNRDAVRIPNTQDIYVYDLSSGTEQKLATSRRDKEMDYDFSGDWVVWAELESAYPEGESISSTRTTDVHALNISTGVHWTAGTPGVSDCSPVVWGDRMVYLTGSGSTNTFFEFNLATGEQTRLFGPERGQFYYADLEGDQLAWMRDTGMGSVHLYDITSSTDTTIWASTDEHYAETFRPPSFRNGTIAWTDWELTNYTSGLSAYDVASGQIHHVNDVGWDGYYWEVSTDGEWIVFERDGYSSGDSYIHYLRLGDGFGVGSGTDVAAEDASSGVSVEFDTVTLPGFVNVTHAASPGAAPGGFTLQGSDVLNIEFNGRQEGTITVGVSYDEAAITVPEADLRLMHWNGASWDDVTTSVDTTNNIIYGDSPSLSPFGVFGASGGATGVAVPAGTDVEIVFANGVRLIFDEVLTAGSASAEATASRHSGVDGAVIVADAYYDIDTDAVCTGGVTVEIPYSASFDGSAALLKMRHWDGVAEPQDITTSVDQIQRVVTGRTTSFSDFWIEAPYVPGPEVSADANLSWPGWICVVLGFAALFVWRSSRA